MGPFCQVTSLKPEHHQPEHQCTCERSATTKNHTSTKHLHHLQGAKWNKADFGRFWSALPGSTPTDVRCVLSLSVILGRLWGGNTTCQSFSAAPLCQLPANFCADQILCHLRRGHGGNILGQAASKERRDPNIPETNLETKGRG